MSLELRAAPRHSLVDDHSRLAYSEILADEKGPTCAGFLARRRLLRRPRHRPHRAAEEGGFDSCWVFDHYAPMGPVRTGDVFEAWTLLAAMASTTRRVRIGSIVTGNIYRHPAVLAKMAVTVDHLSNGRLIMGLGAGGDEHADLRMGWPQHGARERIDRLEEACQVLKALWAEPTGGFIGQHYAVPDADPVAWPKPVQWPRPPLWLGSSGERFGLRVVAEHADGWFSAAMPGTGPEESVRVSRILDQHCRTIGRDPLAVRRAVQFPLPDSTDETLHTAEAYVRAGFTDVVLMILGAGETAVAQAETAAALLPALRELG